MNLEQAMAARRSRRRYKQERLDPSVAAKLRQLIDEYNAKGNIRMELVQNDGRAFNGFTKSYGMFKGVNDFVELIINKDDAESSERMGYYGELLILHATVLGLGTCWVGGTYSRSDIHFQLAENEAISGVITVGNTEEQDSLRERFIRKMTHRKTKSAEEMYTADSPVPDWFVSGMKAVQNAPSAVNRQPVMFVYNNGRVTASVKDISAPMMGLDFGIAKLHFALGAGGGTWEWGNNGAFNKGFNKE